MTDTTALASIIEKIVSTDITETLHQNAVMLGAVRDFSSRVGQGMDRVDIPLYANPTIGNVDEATGVADNAIGVAVAQLLLDQHKGAGTHISRRASKQQKIDSVKEWIKNATLEMASEVDDYMLGLLEALGAANREALTANAIDDIAFAKKILDDQKVPKTDRFLVASPGFMQNLLTTSSIIRANEYGTSAPIQAGFVANVLGFSILETQSSSIVDNGFHAFHRTGVAFARQIDTTLMKEEKALLVRDEYSISHLYGAQLTDAAAKRAVVFDADGL